jgi:hypothetical protein
MDGWYPHFKQRKTKLYHVLPMSPQAKELLAERTESNRLMFKDLKYSSKLRLSFVDGPSRQVSLSRPHFIPLVTPKTTLLLSHGVDIYTISKLLSHNTWYLRNATRT